MLDALILGCHGLLISNSTTMYAFIAPEYVLYLKFRIKLPEQYHNTECIQVVNQSTCSCCPFGTLFLRTFPTPIFHFLSPSLCGIIFGAKKNALFLQPLENRRPNTSIKSRWWRKDNRKTAVRLYCPMVETLNFVQQLVQMLSSSWQVKTLF